MVKQKSYSKVGEINKCMPDHVDGETPEAPRFGDMSEAWNDAETVLLNWIEIATFNIGTSATIAIMDKAKKFQET